MESFKQDVIELYETGNISKETMNILLEKCEDGYVEEDVKDAVSKVKDIVTKSKVSKVVNNVADKYNDGLNKRSEVVAKAIVRKPKFDKDNSSHSEVYEKYKKDIQKWRTTYKVAEIIATGAIAIGPLDAVIKAATFSAMKRSNDPVDKSTMEVINKIKSKVTTVKDKMKSLVSKVKSKEINESQLKSELNSLEAEGSVLAKQTDTVNKKIAITESKNLTEDTLQLFDNIILENGEMTDKSYDILFEFIDNADFTDGTTYTLLERYL